MDNKFKPWLVCLSDKAIKDTCDNIKEEDKLLFAKLSMINFCDSNGYDTNKSVKKIKKMTEKKLIEFVDSEVCDIDIKSIDDICNLFADDMSDMENFFFAYCLYNDYYGTDVYKENIKCGNRQ